MVVSFPKVFLGPDEPFACAGVEADNYFIFPNGRVYRCPLCEDYPLNGFAFKKNRLIQLPKINEMDFFSLRIPEGCVMNKIIQPGNLLYTSEGAPAYKIACCMLKEKSGRTHPDPVRIKRVAGCVRKGFERSSAGDRDKTRNPVKIRRLLNGYVDFCCR
jgi:hypothetical protein